ncbi:MAG TPA: hypothetical protein VKI41_07000 [Vicinamibacteria bacterium]|nr:hypothetical protein [Vicinamibacteria bacterium]
MRAQRLLFAFLFALTLAAPVRGASGKVEAIGPFTGPASASVKQALDPAGYRVRLADGTVACEVWFSGRGAGLSPSAFVGVLSFPAPASDFRGQAIKAGSYTLRYAQMPGDGNHLGAAPTTDFLLLSPLAVDTDAGASFSFEKLTKMSALASGTNHPAPLNLADPSGQKAFPAVAGNEYGHEVFFVKLKAAGGGDVAIGLVVKGSTDH